MSKNNGAQKTEKQETTLAGLLEAALDGMITSEDLVKAVDDDPKILEANGPADLAMNKFKQMAKRGKGPMGRPNLGLDDEEVEDNMDAAAEAGCPAPGSKIRSQGQGQGLARGRGRGPLGRPDLNLSDEDVADNMDAAAEAGCDTPGSKIRSQGRGRGLARGRGRGPIGRQAVESTDEPAVVPDSALTLSTFESMVDEASGLKPKKKKAAKKTTKKMKDATESRKGGKRILEFAAPERQDVIAWARGKEPKRIGEGKTPFWFDGNEMISKNVVIAVRNLEEKQAQVVHPRYLDAYTGRHAILANHGLRYANYDVEIVDGL